MSYLRNPLKNGRINLSNRLVMPPMATSKAMPDGKVSQGLLDYYNEKSAGGYISLIIIEHSYVSKLGQASAQQLSVADDTTLEGLRMLASVIHKNGSKTMMQINHAGSMTMEDIIKSKPIGPSSVVNPRKGIIPRELTREEIKDTIVDFRDAALRVKSAGFDGVEIHSAHGYLLNQFLSPLTNHRSDEYGGSLLNRIRLHLEIIHEVRTAVGSDFPILLRLGASDFTDGGTTINDSQTAAALFAEAGIDALDISGGFSGYIVPGLTDQGYFASISQAIKEVVSIPVILTGGITEPDAAERLLAEKKADLIGVGRAILADSLWAKRAMEL
ncbi:NADH:flavin oxidoreductase/NADH oxidase [Candidatus Desulfosporosinus infrequens]|uniref:NADH:flavin oxidoreductase/NADH oxidase n=1 Tax=Candidatus Desulfosporosinus infrequens TaxID=2043169 RepID=A0A2U3KMG4_9FIRM|nr:NADH:flavin oxidoreductase/NADH oxidase [Candidatus Desulfosporosinus infrequens]